MKKLWTSLIVSIVIGIILLGGTVSATLVKDTSHTVTIKTTGSRLAITEAIEVNNTGAEKITLLQFWIQQEAKDIVIAEKNTVLPRTISGNIYTCNLTTLNLSLAQDQTMTLRVTYTIPKNVEYFQKTISYDTTSFVVVFDNKELYRGETLNAYSSVRLLLYKPTEAPLNLMYIIIVVLLVILLIASALVLLKKQRTKTAGGSIRTGESEELLATKKTILLNALKDIEKQHRAKSITDETYNKLKEDYKQQAVDVMKKIDDLQTKP